MDDQQQPHKKRIPQKNAAESAKVVDAELENAFANTKLKIRSVFHKEFKQIFVISFVFRFS